MWALRKQLAEQNLLPKALDLYDALRYSVYTDVSKWDTLKYARFGLSLGEADVKGLVLKPPDAMRAGWRQDMSVFIVNWDYIAEELKGIFDRPPLIDTNTSFSPEIPQPDDGGRVRPGYAGRVPVISAGIHLFFRRRIQREGLETELDETPATSDTISSLLSKRAAASPSYIPRAPEPSESFLSNT